MLNTFHLALAFCLFQSEVLAFSSPSSSLPLSHVTPKTTTISSSSCLYATPPPPIKKPNPDSNLTPVEQESLAQTFGGYTVKQRLREEVESPFRKVRFLFFLSSTGSAFIAFYFSFLSALKAYMGGFSDAVPLDEALTNCAINIAGVVVCGYLAYRDYQAGQGNLERIAKGGALAKLAVSPGNDNERAIRTLSDFRRTSRVLICAGGKEYIENVCRSLNDNSTNNNNNNNLPQLLDQVDVLVVPVLLTDTATVGDSKSVWRGTTTTTSSSSSLSSDNFDSTRSDGVVAFPWSNASWADYLKSEIETAKTQGFDVLSKGITITVKKNGKILRRATGAPRWPEFVGTMEVLDGSKFGMPGDSEKYGGP